MLAPGCPVDAAASCFCLGISLAEGAHWGGRRLGRSFHSVEIKRCSERSSDAPARLPCLLKGEEKDPLVFSFISVYQRKKAFVKHQRQDLGHKANCFAAGF